MTGVARGDPRRWWAKAAGGVAGVLIFCLGAGTERGTAQTVERRLRIHATGAVTTIYPDEAAVGSRDVGDLLQWTSELQSLNPFRVERIEVLRDVATTSVYGGRGARGVLLIFTRGIPLAGKGDGRRPADKAIVGVRRAPARWERAPGRARPAAGRPTGLGGAPGPARGDARRKPSTRGRSGEPVRC